MKRLPRRAVQHSLGGRWPSRRPPGAPPGAAPEPSKVRRLAENRHSAPIIEDNERPPPAPERRPPGGRGEAAGAAEARHRRRRLDAPAARRVARYAGQRRVSSETSRGAARRPEIVVVSAPPDIVNISISGESLRADTPEPDEAEPPPPPPPPPLVFGVAGAARAAGRRARRAASAVPRAMSEQRDRSSDFEPLRFGKGTFGAVVLVRRRSRLDAPGEGRRYAMKVLLKGSSCEKSRREMAMVEREILRTVRHPFLVSLACSFQSKTRLYSSDALLLWRGFRCPPEREENISSRRSAAHIARLSLAVDFLHRSGVIHEISRAPMFCWTRAAARTRGLWPGRLLR